MITYEQWNKAIISYFLEEWEPGQIAFLQTNTEMLSEIADKSDFNVSNAVNSLKRAVRHKAVVYGTVNFWAINPKLWINYSTQEPPQVAFLALTVLAASLMESDDSVASHNYYNRLNEVLFGESVKGIPQGFNRYKFEDFWKHLQEWLRDYHNIELYLTEGSSSRRYVWYPISQCLISTHDRRNVYRFFRNYNLTPFSDISDNQFEKDFLAWLRPSGLTKIERYFSNESYKQSILSQVKSLLQHWDGEIPPESTQTKRQTTANVNVELRFDMFGNVEIRYWFPTRGRNKIRCKTNHLGIHSLETSHLEKWFQPVIDNRGAFWNWNLLNRLQLQTNEANPIVYTLGFSNIWVFQKDPERDDSWLSQRNMQLYEDHLIVFRKDLVNQVVDCLRKTCGQEIEKPSPIYVDSKENDWLYLLVRPIKLVSFSKQELWRLSVNSGERIRFIGGISVKDRYGRRAYLDICVPTVFVPDLGVPDQELLQIGEQLFPIGENRLVSLDNILELGVYQLTYREQTKELRVISPERSLEHYDRTLIATISEDRTTTPVYAVKEILEFSEASDIWLAGAKLIGDISPSLSPIDDELSNVPAHIISSVVKVAIDAKQGKGSIPEWFDEAIECLDQNVVLRAFVEKKLNFYGKAALSYMKLRERIGK